MQVSGRSEKPKGNKKKLFSGKCKILILAFALIVSGVVLYFVLSKNKDKKEYSFTEIENQFFYMFNVTFPKPENYEFYSVEAYCIDDDNISGMVHYFVHAKYKAFIDIENKWAEIDEVAFGDNGRLENSYCLSWPSIDGFESENELFQRAVREGTKKSYSAQEIQELLRKNSTEK